jgi:adhesin transport system outer membrane protein
MSLLVVSTTLQAQSLTDTIESIQNNNSEIKAINYSNEVSKKSVNKSESSYLPKIDLELTGEKKKTKTKLDNNPTNTVDQSGYDLRIQLEQLIWDGGLTKSSINEAKYKELVDNFVNKVKSEDILLSGITAYFEILKYTKRVDIANENIQKNIDHLKIAQENEKLTDEALETYQAKAKLALARKILLDEEEGLLIAKSNYKRITGNDITTTVDTPKIDKNLVPASLKELIELTLNNNNEIKAQKQNILRQNEISLKQDSANKPNIKFYLAYTHDDDLLAEDTVQNNYSAKVVLKYNLYNGGSDKISTEIERVNLQKEKINLETTANSVIDQVTMQYSRYNKSLKRIDELKVYLDSNKNIMDIYQSQFEGGMKTFSDILDAWTDVYNSKKLLSDEYIVMNEAYFNILKLSGQLNNIQKTK